VSYTSDKYNAPLDFRIPFTAPENIDPPVRLAFEEVYAGMRQIIRALVDLCGIGPKTVGEWTKYKNSTSTILSGNLRRFYAEAAEDITSNQLIAFWDSGAGLKVRLANATDNTRVAVGYCSTASGVLTGGVGEFVLGTGVPLFAGLTIGAHYWLSTTAGAISNTPAVAAGNVEQYVGIAISTTELSLALGPWIQH